MNVISNNTLGIKGQSERTEELQCKFHSLHELETARKINFHWWRTAMLLCSWYFCHADSLTKSSDERGLPCHGHHGQGMPHHGSSDDGPHLCCLHWGSWTNQRRYISLLRCHLIWATLLQCYQDISSKIESLLIFEAACKIKDSGGASSTWSPKWFWWKFC